MNEMLKEFFAYFLGGEAMKKIFNFFKNSLGDVASQQIAEKLPLFLGLSKKDEAKWATFMAQLTHDQRKKIADLLEGLHDYIKNHFRYVVVTMTPEKIFEKTDPKTGKVTETKYGDNQAIKFLREMCETIDASNIEEARRQCYAGNILMKDPVHRQILEKMQKGNAWFKDKVLAPLHLTSLNDIYVKAGVLLSKIKETDKGLADSISKRTKTIIPKPKGGFWYGFLGIKGK
jgi:hypothetical protein